MNIQSEWRQFFECPLPKAVKRIDSLINAAKSWPKLTGPPGYKRPDALHFEWGSERYPSFERFLPRLSARPACESVIYVAFLEEDRILMRLVQPDARYVNEVFIENRGMYSVAEVCRFIYARKARRLQAILDGVRQDLDLRELPSENAGSVSVPWPGNEPDESSEPLLSDSEREELVSRLVASVADSSGDDLSYFIDRDSDLPHSFHLQNPAEIFQYVDNDLAIKELAWNSEILKLERRGENRVEILAHDPRIDRFLLCDIATEGVDFRWLRRIAGVAYLARQRRLFTIRDKFAEVDYFDAGLHEEFLIKCDAIVD
jgi:hypothetical protein